MKNKSLELYRQGKCSLDKAAKIAGITVSEMMQEAVAEGIKSTETIEEYREGLKLLDNLPNLYISLIKTKKL